MTGLAAIVIAYLLGSIPFGYLLTRFLTGKDVRASGSGNIGATNVMRSAGRGAGVATLVLDALKGTLAVWIASLLTDASQEVMAVAALCVMGGHVFPVFLKFKGGKAVATFTGAFAYLTPLPLLGTVVIFVLTVWSTRYISAGSVIAAATFPLGVWLVLHPGATVVEVSIAAAALIVFRHRENIERIRAGNERVFQWSRGK